MSARVRVTLDDEGAVAVKVASGEAEVTRLRREADRLRRASHPGVVTLLDVATTDSGAELRTRYAGEPLDRWHGSLASVAGLGAAVAATLADLHGLGVVHGRVDASHILVGAGGRPRLCGMSGRDGAEPADDVAALAAVLDDLATAARPSRRWRSAAERRAVAAVLRDAREPVAGRRPGPAAFARALLAAVPGAALPEPVPGPAPTPARRAPHGNAASPAADGAVGATRGSDTRAPSDPADDTAEFDDFWSGPPDLERFRDDLGPPIGHPVDDLTTAHLGSPGRRGGTAGQTRGAAALTAGTPVVRLRQRDGNGPGRPPSMSADRGRPQSGTSPRPSGRAARRRRRPEPGMVVAAAALAVGVGGVAVALALTGAGAGGDPGHEAAPAPATATHAPGAPGGTCPPVSAPAADVDGDGCPERLRIHERTVTAGDARWALGEPGDLVAVGDWDCDGGATAALLRPGTGEVFVFPGWAPAGRPLTVAATDRVRHAADLRTERDGDGCDRLLVERTTGGTTAVGLPGEVAADDRDADGRTEDR